jgi:XTP/dITP diphosphohydrolase
MTKVVLATGNKGKVREINQILQGLDYQVIPQTELNVSEAVEDGLTFIENALKKARHAAASTGMAAIADDSGIAVDALNGRPGIYSARYAGEGANDSDNCQLLLKEMEDVSAPDRTARFHCVMVYLRHVEDPTPIICHGVWEGSITQAPRGENGFGYDPVFWVEAHQCTAAQLASEQKNCLSHRGKALKQLVDALSA